MNNHPIFRAHMVGKLMTEPRSKSEGPLSIGAKTAIRDIAAQHILGIEFEISGKELAKGIECEPDSNALLNRVMRRSLVKNTERRTNGLWSGECDLFDAERAEGFDLKTAWSAASFPIVAEDIGGSQRALYEWQCRAYMALWNADRWHVAYALVNTPEHLIGYEPQSMHFFDHIPEHMRLTVWTVERDLTLEAQLREKVMAARDYFNRIVAEFDRTHPAPGAEPPPWEEPKAPAAPVAAKPATTPAALPADIFE